MWLGLSGKEQANTETYRQSIIGKVRHKNEPADTQTDRQTDRQTDTPTYKET